MSLTIGIVGLPNVGKSTLFNAITHSSIPAENYPFCTIAPNKGIVPIPDSRLEKLADISQSASITHATIEFVDIAGLVKGASKGEGLGNTFLSHIRDTSVIVHLVRCFPNDKIVHVHGALNPRADIDIINLELLYADLDMAEKQVEKAKKNQKEESAKYALFTKIRDGLAQNIPVRKQPLTEAERLLLKGYCFLTDKKIIYVANLSEDMIGQPSSFVASVQEIAEKESAAFLCLCAKLEEELSQLSPEDKKAYLKEFGLSESGLDALVKASFTLFDLQTYLTSGKKESRAWTIPKGTTAPKAAGVIHTDFEKGFIRANVVSFDHFVALGGWKGAKEKGLVRQEGKEYMMREGDVVEFLFNV